MNADIFTLNKTLNKTMGKIFHAPRGVIYTFLLRGVFLFTARYLYSPRRNY